MHFPGSIAHCVSSDFQMSKGIAQQIRDAYPALQPTLRSIETPQVGASVSMHIPSQNKSIFNLVTKSQYFKKPSYHDLTRSLRCMKKQLIEQGIKQIALPKIGCGLDKLQEHSVFNIIYDIFRKRNTKVLICLNSFAALSLNITSPMTNRLEAGPLGDNNFARSRKIHLLPMFKHYE